MLKDKPPRTLKEMSMEELLALHRLYETIEMRETDEQRAVSERYATFRANHAEVRAEIERRGVAA